MKKLPYIFLALITAAVISGCSPKVYERMVTVSDTLVRTDTLRVVSRPDTVKVMIPGSSQDIVTKDTASHLEDGLYESDASWDGRFLHHSLKSKPGASLNATVIVHDTIKVKAEEKKSNRDSSKTKTVYVKPSLKDRIWNFLSGMIAGVVASILYVSRKRIKEAIKKALLKDS